MRRWLFPETSPLRRVRRNEIALPGSSGRGVGIEGIYYRGLREHSEYSETTRLAAIQVGFVFPVG